MVHEDRWYKHEHLLLGGGAWQYCESLVVNLFDARTYDHLSASGSLKGSTDAGD